MRRAEKCDIEKIVLLQSFEPSEVFPACTLDYHRNENYNNQICTGNTKEPRMVSVASIEKVTNGAVICQCKLCGRCLFVIDRLQ